MEIKKQDEIQIRYWGLNKNRFYKTKYFSVKQTKINYIIEGYSDITEIAIKIIENCLYNNLIFSVLNILKMKRVDKL